MNLAILTNGGDSCALNASIEAIRREARKVRFGKIIGIQGGYHGLLYKNYRSLAERVDRRMGGTILRSLRYSPCRRRPDGSYELDRARADKMVDTLKELEVDVLVVVGGDGTLKATKLFHQHVQDKYRFRIMGFPKTIDNDIRTKSSFAGMEVALCPGYPTAALKIGRVVQSIRTTAISAQRVFGIETMGRDAGWLAAAADYGGPDMILIPEVPLTQEMKERLLERTRRFFRAFLNVVIAVSEGTKWVTEDGDIEQVKMLEFGPRKLGGVADRLVKYIEEQLTGEFDEKTPFEVRPHHADYVPRAGDPCEYDLKLVDVLAHRLRLLLEKEEYGKVPVLRTVVPFEELSVEHADALDFDEMEAKLFPEDDFYDRERLLPTKAFTKFLRTVVSGPDTDPEDRR